MTISVVLVGLVTATAIADAPAAPTSREVEFFESRIRPVLAEHCFRCHGPQKQRAGLRLDSAEALQKGSESGVVLVPGHPEKSILIQAVRQEGDLKMPQKGKLPPAAIADLTAWVQMGAPWPATVGQPAAAAEDSLKKHWAFQAVRKPALPA